jgi:hypothetical protein
MRETELVATLTLNHDPTVLASLYISAGHLNFKPKNKLELWTCNDRRTRVRSILVMRETEQLVATLTTDRN